MDQNPPTSDCKPLLQKYIENGKIVKPLPSPKEIRDYVIKQLTELQSS
jgi:nicotinate phosphoribosyltransferase